MAADLPLPSFVLRTPLLPTDVLVAFGDGLEGPGADEHSLPDALARDREKLTARLLALLARPEIDRALAFASPSLHARLPAFRADPERGDPTIARALVRYLARMATRATPAGLLAGASIGRLGGETSLGVCDAADARLRARVSFDVLWAAMAALAQQAGAGAPLHSRALAYEVGDRLRILALRSDQGTRAFELVDGPAHAEALRALTHPQGAPATPDAVVAQLEALGLLARSPLPSPTSADPLGDMRAWAERHRPGAAVQLKGAQDALARLDGARLGQSREPELGVAAAVSALHPASSATSSPLRVSLIKPAELSLSDEVAAEVRRAAHIVAALGEPRGDRLSVFRDQFRARYGDDWVPLLHALDEDAGIPFEAFANARLDLHPILAGLPLAASGPPAGRTAALDSAAGPRPRELEVELPSPLPAAELGPAWFVLASFARPEQDSAELRVLVEAVSSLPLRLLGPLAAQDPAFAELAREVIAREDQPGVVHAELLHLIEGPGADVMVRARLRAAELPILATPSASAEDCIDPADLLVAVRDRRVLLYSRRLEREVRPCLSTPHNAARGGLPLFRFLVAVAEQDRRDLRPRWRSFEGAAFRPRMVHGRAVLARACWRLAPEELAAFRARDASPEGLFAAARALVRSRGLDRSVSLVESDRKLPIDFENILSIESFADRVRAATEPVVLEEIWPPLGASPVHCPEGELAHEALIVFGAPRGRSARTPLAASDVVLRRPEPVQLPVQQGPWHCFHLYTGERWIDRALQACGPIAARLVARGDADRWHFLRYWDPEPHLRLRVRIPDRSGAAVLDALRGAIAQLHASDVAWRVTTERYAPELERYGGAEGVELTERIACADSELALELAQLPALLRWDACLLASDALLADLGSDVQERRAVVELLRRHAHDTLGGAAELLHAVRHRQRALRPRIQALFAAPQHPWSAALARRSEVLRALAPRVAALRAENPGGWLGIAGSWLHLCINRHLDGSHRAHELVLGLGLQRHYDERAHKGES